MKKKRFLIPVALLLVSSISFQSCIGSFSLTNKVLNWNRNVNNKFVNELVFFAFWVLPVYEVTAAADLLVINSIEFWSGNNPLEASNKTIETEHGNYIIIASETGYTVKAPDGSTTCFAYDADTQTWSFQANGNEKVDFLRFVDSDHVQMINGIGEFVDVELSRDGVNSYAASLGAPFMALN